MGIVLDFDPRTAAASLDRAERRRLVEIAQAEKALPWIEVDDVLEALEFVARYRGVFDEPLASIGRYGWQVLDAIGRYRSTIRNHRQ